MTELENFKLLGVALAIGLLIGLERGWRTRDREEGMRVAGLRTYGMISLLGGLSGILTQQVNAFFIGFVFLGLSSVLLLAYSKSIDKFGDFSITSIIASLITFTLGALTAFNHITLACASAVVITSLLGFKPLLHGWMKKLEQRELHATLELLLISVVILPILPDQGYGPWNAFNPYHIWWMVVLIAGISYLGYFAIRIGGNQHGPVLTGAFGGLVRHGAESRLQRIRSTSARQLRQDHSSDGGMLGIGAPFKQRSARFLAASTASGSFTRGPSFDSSVAPELRNSTQFSRRSLAKANTTRPN